MIRISKPATEKKAHRMADGTDTFQTHILNPPDGGPQAFLVEMVPGSEIPPHFHHTTQFQIAVDGDGKLGRHALSPKAVHYTQRHSTYGPIIAGEKGLSYLTLRPRKDISGAHWMPENNKKVDRTAPRRQVTMAPKGDAKVDSGIAIEEVIPKDETGLGSWLLRLPAGASIDAPGLKDGQGQFQVVIDGSMEVNGEEFSHLSTAFVTEDEDCKIHAGKEGLELLIVQFPRDSWVPGEAVTSL